MCIQQPLLPGAPLAVLPHHQHGGPRDARLLLGGGADAHPAHRSHDHIHTLGHTGSEALPRDHEAASGEQ